MNGLIERLISQIKAEKRSIGKIIDDRGANGIPKFSYVDEYNKLETLEKAVGAFTE